MRDDSDMDQSLDSRMRVILAVALTSIIIGGTADLVMDDPQTWLSFHVIFETLMIAGALLMATTLWLGWWKSAHSVVALRESLEKQRAERDAFKASANAALEGLGRAIDAQFRTWHLTPTEREVALMLLKDDSEQDVIAVPPKVELKALAGFLSARGIAVTSIKAVPRRYLAPLNVMTVLVVAGIAAAAFGLGLAVYLMRT